MKKRLPYLISFLVLLGIEIYIGACVHDATVRPYVGDVLVTILLCCMGRILFPEGLPWLPTAVFAFAVVVECIQLIRIPALEGTIWGIILGSTFDWTDLVCYGIGCLCFAAAEGAARRWGVQ